MTLELHRHFTFYGNITFKKVLFPGSSYYASLLDSDVSVASVAPASHFTWSFVLFLLIVRDVRAPSGITFITNFEEINLLVQSQNEEVM
jgi:hypothetical protein